MSLSEKLSPSEAEHTYQKTPATCPRCGSTEQRTFYLMNWNAPLKRMELCLYFKLLIFGKIEIMFCNGCGRVI